MKDWVPVAAIALPVLLATGCIPKSAATFEDGRLRHAEHGYAFYYRGDDLSTAMGPDWLVDNYRRVARTGGGGKRQLVWKPKEGSEYRITRRFDTTGNGQADALLRNQQAYDLRLKHRNNDGQLWLSSIPLPTELGQKDLRVLAARYVDATSGAGSVYVRFGQLGDAAGAVEQRWGTRVSMEGECVVGGAEAYEIDFELVNVDRAQAGDGSADERVRLVLIDPGFTTTLRRPHKKGHIALRTVLLAVHSNRPEDYPSTARDFGDFLQQISFAGKRGATCGAEQVSVGDEDATENLVTNWSATEGADTPPPAKPAEPTTLPLQGPPRGSIQRRGSIFVYEFSDTYAPDSSKPMLVEQGYDGGGASWQAIAYGLLTLHSPATLAQLEMEASGDTLTIRAGDAAPLQTVAKLVGAAKQDSAVLAAAIQRAVDDGKMR